MQSLLFNTGTDELDPRSLTSIKCRDLGMDCSFKTKGVTEPEIIRQLIDHLKSEHDMPFLTAEILFRMKKGIKKY